MKARLLLLALAVVASRTAFAQVEVPMTPTPAPTSTPVIAPIPTYPPKTGGDVTPATDDHGKVRIDRAGMFGAGFHIGNTSTGATGKLWFGEDVATQFAVGSGPLGNDLRFQLDLLYSPYRFEAEDNLYALPFYVGLGGQMGIFFKNPNPVDRTDVGLRIPMGMSVVIPDNPVELFFEVAPDFATYTTSADKNTSHFVFYVDGQIGARFYF